MLYWISIFLTLVFFVFGIDLYSGLGVALCFIFFAGPILRLILHLIFLDQTDVAFTSSHWLFQWTEYRRGMYGCHIYFCNTGARLEMG